MTTSFTLTAAQCKALLLHIPKSHIRYYLIGLHLSPDAIVSATDDHLGLRIKVEVNGPAVDAIIPRELVALAAKSKYATAFFIADGRASITGSMSLPLVEGKFPDVERVCPMVAPSTLVPSQTKFNLQYHLDARNAIDLLTRGKPAVHLFPVDWLSTSAAAGENGYHYGDGFAMVIGGLRA